MISMDKKYKTKDGVAVTLLNGSIRDHHYPITGIVHYADRDFITQWSENGLCSYTSRMDLVEFDELAEFRNLPIDTPVWVRNDDGLKWRRRHWALLDTRMEGVFFGVWTAGLTSHTVQTPNSVSFFRYCTTTDPDSK